MIDSFRGPYFFLSNFYSAVVEYDGLSYPTVEHAYQAAKTPDLAARENIRCLPTPNQARRAGRKVELRLNWNDQRVPIMRYLVGRKFINHPNLADLLLATGDQELIEGNAWGDRFWGVYRGQGENQLGKILMEVRNGLKWDRVLYNWDRWGMVRL